jgi:hypothetical protein
LRRHALELLLRQHEPFPAVALDRRWDLLKCNAAWTRLLGILPGAPPQLAPHRVLPAPRLNLLKLLVGALRPIVVNWDEVAPAILERARREAATDRDPVRRRVLEECASEAPAAAAALPPGAALPLVVAVELQLGDRRARLFSTTTTLGTAQDITLQELRIESFHPADAATEELVRGLA